MPQYTHNIIADLALYGTFAFIIFVLWYGFRNAKKGDKQSPNLTVNEVINNYRDKITSNDFLWAVRQNGNSFDERILLVKDYKGDLVARITRYGLPNKPIAIEIGDKKFERARDRAPFSNKLVLREVDSGEILISCSPSALKQEYMQGESKLLKFTLHAPSIFHDPNSHLIKMDDGTNGGNLFAMKKFKYDALLLNISVKNISRMDQIFIFSNFI